MINISVNDGILLGFVFFCFAIMCFGFVKILKVGKGLLLCSVYSANSIR